MNEHTITAMTTANRKDYASRLLSFTDETTSLLQAIFAIDPAPGSPAHMLRVNETEIAGRWTGPIPVSQAQEAILLACVAGVDHARLFATSLMDPKVMFSVATVARSTIEAFSRAWWLLSAEDQKCLVNRWASAAYREISRLHRLNPNVHLLSWEGPTKRTADGLADILQDLTLVSDTGHVLAVSYTELATALGDEVSPSGRQLYSHLSSVAHGDALVLHGFMAPTRRDGQAGLLAQLPEQYAKAYIDAVFISTAKVLRRLVDYWGCSPDLAKSWEESHQAMVRFVYRDRQLAEHS